MSEIINFACVTQNRIKNLKRNLPKIVDYVDRIIIVDGYSVDGTKEWCEQFSPKVTVVQREWDDSFANQYNRYLREVNDGWVLICDDDEIPSKELLNNLRSIVIDSNNGDKYSVVSVRCNPMEIDGDGNIINDPGPVNYYRDILFKYNPGMKYMVDLHQSLKGYCNGKVIRCEKPYYHLKSDEDGYRNACRNWWIAGVWDDRINNGYQPPEWHEFKKIVTEAYPNVKVFGDFNAIMVKGNIKQEVKDYLEKIKDITDEQPLRLFNELRAYWKYYYEKLHPEEVSK